MTIHGRRATGALVVGVVLGLTASLAWAQEGADPAAATTAPKRLPHRGAVHVAHTVAVPDPNAKAPGGGSRLALQAPALDRIYPRQQLRYILADSGGGVDVQDMSVSVQTKLPSVAVPVGQLYAIPWAFLHPTQAWRILTPVVGP